EYTSIHESVDNRTRTPKEKSKDPQSSQLTLKRAKKSKNRGKLKEMGWVKEGKSPCVMLVILVPKKNKS
ncbi:hypothetical protein CR513_47203, partial [Mucuna pruriens]